MIITSLPRFEVRDATYGSEVRGNKQIDVLRLRVDDGDGGQATTTVKNAKFDITNNALCVIAYLGVSPSTLSDAEGATIPLTIDVGGNLAVPGLVVQQGREALVATGWGPDPSRETNVTDGDSATSDASQ